MTKKSKKEIEDEDTEETPEEEAPPTEEQMSALAQLLGGDGPQLKSVMLFGDVDEERVTDIIAGLILLCGDPDNCADTVKMYISTNGGAADDMFALYDMMNMAKKSCTIETIGLGKVMSAGVLLLASGTKGHRKIGKHCRVMIHSCNAGNIGDYHNLKNEMKQIQDLQEKYIKALVQETSLTTRQLNKLLDRKVNIYLTAEEAIEYGIADEIF